MQFGVVLAQNLSAIPGLLHQLKLAEKNMKTDPELTKAASHGVASSGIGDTPFGATSAFMHGMHQMQAGRPAVGDAGTPCMNLQLFSRRQSHVQGPPRSVAATELDDSSPAPDIDDSGKDDRARLEADMSASKKAVAKEDRNEKKAASAAKKNKRPEKNLLKQYIKIGREKAGAKRTCGP